MVKSFAISLINLTRCPTFYLLVMIYLRYWIYLCISWFSYFVFFLVTKLVATSFRGIIYYRSYVHTRLKMPGELGHIHSSALHVFLIELCFQNLQTLSKWNSLFYCKYFLIILNYAVFIDIGCTGKVKRPDFHR